MGKNVFITGATSGIGRETAIAFAKHGDNLLLCARRADKLDEKKTALESMYKVKVTVFVLDVTDRKAVTEIVPQMVEKIGGVDIKCTPCQGHSVFYFSKIWTLSFSRIPRFVH